MNARQPQDVFSFFDDFMGPTWSLDADSVSTVTTTTSAPWTFTSVGGGAKATCACVDATYSYPSTLGGILRMTTVATADYGGNMQVAGTQFVVDQDVGLPLYFEARFRTADVSNTDIFVGLSAVDTEIITSGADDAIGFLLESGVLYAHTAETSNETSADCAITEADGAATTSNAGWVRVAFYFDGSNSVTFLCDGNDDGVFDYVTTKKVGTGIDYLPDDQALTPTIEMIVGTTASAETADFDYVYCVQQRYHA